MNNGIRVGAAEKCGRGGDGRELLSTAYKIESGTINQRERGIGNTHTDNMQTQEEQGQIHRRRQQRDRGHESQSEIREQITTRVPHHPPNC